MCSGAPGRQWDEEEEEEEKGWVGLEMLACGSWERWGCQWFEFYYQRNSKKARCRHTVCQRDNFLFLSADLALALVLRWLAAFASFGEQWLRKWFAASFWGWLSKRPLSSTAAAHTFDSCWERQLLGLEVFRFQSQLDSWPSGSCFPDCHLSVASSGSPFFDFGKMIYI